MLGKRQDIGEALAERGNVDRDHADPEIEVLTKPACRHLGRQIPVGGTEDPHVDRDRTAADRSDLARLQHPQELGLQGKTHVADLIEKKGAPLRVTEGPGTITVGTGEGAADMAEEFALEEIGGDRRAIDRNEGARPAAAEIVNGARHHLLAGPRLAGDEHGHIAIGEPSDPLLDLAHRRTRADQPALRSGGRRRRGGGGEHAAEKVGERLAPDRLGEIVKSPETHGLDGGETARRGGDDRNRRGGGTGHDVGEYGKPLAPRQTEIEEDRLHAARPESGEPLGSVRGKGGLVAEIGDGLGKAFPKGRIVVDDQNARHGSSTSKTAPCPSSPASRMVPP